MTWNHDLTTAPLGRTVPVMRNTRTKDGVIRVPVQEFEPDHVWLATKCDKVLKSYWIPATDRNAGRWAWFANGEQPVAWQAFVVPTHPNLRDGANEQPEAHGSSPCIGAGEAHRPATYGQLVTAGETAPSIPELHVFLDDCGSGA